jgi:hypothetical protein
MFVTTTARAASIGGWFLLLVVAVGSCKREEETARYPQPTPTATGWGPEHGQQPPPPAPTSAPPPAATPEPPAPSVPPAPPEPPPQPTQAPAGPPPAVGFPCASDADLHCPFARCVGGRCGGCRNDADCKPGAACASSPLGMACIPGSGAGAPAPTPTSAPAPAPTAPPATTPPASADPWAPARARCLQRVNEYRAKAGSAAVVEHTQRLTCADSQAQSDAQNKTPHGSFGKCAETAQNECPGWKGSVESVLDSCLKAMFAEGPGTGPAHGHYNNMVEPTYRSVACGFHVAADGAVWIVQDYYR